MQEKTKLIIKARNTDGIEIINISGFLDAHTAPELETEIRNKIDAGSRKILVNFKDLDYISSAGMGVFMEFIEDLREIGGDIKMAEMKPKVFSVFDLLGFPLLFDIETEEANAINKFVLMK